MALGAGETTVLRLVTAYATIANGGRKINATLIDRIQDRFGRTIYQHDQRQCDGCNAASWTGQDEPTLVDNREQVLDPMTAYQITSMMEGVVKRGTATVVQQVGKPIAGKTGTTNDEKDAWFVGFSPDLVVGVFLGYDKPRPMGKGQTGGVIAAPIFTEFMKVALKDAPPKEFQVPPGLELIPIDRRTGLRAQGEGGEVILESFKPGTAPPSTYSIIGYQDTMGIPESTPPLTDRIFRYESMMDAATPVSRWRYRESAPSSLAEFAPWKKTSGAESPVVGDSAGQGYRTLPNGVIIKIQ